MDKDLEAACAALDALATAVTNGWGSDTTMTEGFGWYGPAVTRHELAAMARDLARDIRATDADSLDIAVLKVVQELPRRLQALQANTVPQMYNGNAGQATPAYVMTLSMLRAELLPALGWQVVHDAKALPANLARRARAATAQLDQLTPKIETLTEKIGQIESAHAVAENLPIDLQELAEARDKLSKAAAEAAVSAEKVKEARESSSSELDKMKRAYEEAAKLVKQCEAAYHITTTKGLAGAFDQRAGKLAWSMWTWVGGLIVALVLGSMIGAHRLEVLSVALQAPSPNWGGVAIQGVLSLLSVGAPLWFAWLATKQIGQRFRLGAVENQTQRLGGL